MKKVIFVTSQKGKVEEAQGILGESFLIKQTDVDLEEVQAIESRDVVRHKAKEAFRVLKKPVVVEDTSLYFEAWKGLPGALIRWFLKTVRCEGICKMMSGEKNRKAVAESAMAYYDGKVTKFVLGRVNGSIPLKPRGKFGFGWDSIFIPKGFKKTFAEMTMEEKNQISMRKIALEKLRKYLTKSS